MEPQDVIQKLTAKGWSSTAPSLDDDAAVRKLKLANLASGLKARRKRLNQALAARTYAAFPSKLPLQLERIINAAAPDAFHTPPTQRGLAPGVLMPAQTAADAGCSDHLSTSRDANKAALTAQGLRLLHTHTHPDSSEPKSHASYQAPPAFTTAPPPPPPAGAGAGADRDGGPRWQKTRRDNAQRDTSGSKPSGHARAAQKRQKTYHQSRLAPMHTRGVQGSKNPGNRLHVTGTAASVLPGSQPRSASFPTRLLQRPQKQKSKGKADEGALEATEDGISSPGASSSPRPKLAVFENLAAEELPRQHHQQHHPPSRKRQRGPTPLVFETVGQPSGIEQNTGTMTPGAASEDPHSNRATTITTIARVPPPPPLPAATRETSRGCAPSGGGSTNPRIQALVDRPSNHQPTTAAASPPQYSPQPPAHPQPPLEIAASPDAVVLETVPPTPPGVFDVSETPMAALGGAHVHQGDASDTQGLVQAGQRLFAGSFSPFAELAEFAAAAGDRPQPAARYTPFTVFPRGNRSSSSSSLITTRTRTKTAAAPGSVARFAFALRDAEHTPHTLPRQQQCRDKTPIEDQTYHHHHQQQQHHQQLVEVGAPGSAFRVSSAVPLGGIAVDADVSPLTRNAAAASDGVDVLSSKGPGMSSASLRIRLPQPALLTVGSADGTHFAVLLASHADLEPSEVLVFEVSTCSTEPIPAEDGKKEERPQQPQQASPCCDHRQQEHHQQHVVDVGSHRHRSPPQQKTLRVLASIAVSRSVHASGMELTPSIMALETDQRGGPVLVISAALELPESATPPGNPAIHVVPCAASHGDDSESCSLGSRAVAVEHDEPYVAVATPGSKVILASGIGGEVAIIRFNPSWRSYSWEKSLPVATLHGLELPDICQLLLVTEVKGECSGHEEDTEKKENRGARRNDTHHAIVSPSGRVVRRLIGLSSCGVAALWDVPSRSFIAAKAHVDYALRGVVPLAPPLCRTDVEDTAAATGARADDGAHAQCKKPSVSGVHNASTLPEFCLLARLLDRNSGGGTTHVYDTKHVLAAVLATASSSMAISQPLPGLPDVSCVARLSSSVVAIGCTDGTLLAWDYVSGMRSTAVAKLGSQGKAITAIVVLNDENSAEEQRKQEKGGSNHALHHPHIVGGDATVVVSSLEGDCWLIPASALAVG